jgi:hypothetical protein
MNGIGKPQIGYAGMISLTIGTIRIAPAMRNRAAITCLHEVDELDYSTHSGIFHCRLENLDWRSQLW